MAIIVNELAQSIEKTTLATASNVGKGGMKMAKAFYDGAKPLHVKLAEGLDLTCPFEPKTHSRGLVPKTDYQLFSRGRGDLRHLCRP